MAKKQYRVEFYNTTRQMVQIEAESEEEATELAKIVYLGEVNHKNKEIGGYRTLPKEPGDWDIGLSYELDKIDYLDLKGEG